MVLILQYRWYLTPYGIDSILMISNQWHWFNCWHLISNSIGSLLTKSIISMVCIVTILCNIQHSNIIQFGNNWEIKLTKYSIQRTNNIIVKRYTVNVYIKCNSNVFQTFVHLLLDIGIWSGIFLLDHILQCLTSYHILSCQKYELWRITLQSFSLTSKVWKSSYSISYSYN